VLHPTHCGQDPYLCIYVYNKKYDRSKDLWQGEIDTDLPFAPPVGEDAIIERQYRGTFEINGISSNNDWCMMIGMRVAQCGERDPSSLPIDEDPSPYGWSINGCTVEGGPGTRVFVEPVR